MPAAAGDPTAFPGLVVAIVGAVLAASALAVSIVALVSSRGWAKRSALSSERAAAAAEGATAEAKRANDAREAEVAALGVEWGPLEPTNGHGYLIRNVGARTAYAATITSEQGILHPRPFPSRDVETGDVLNFVAVRLGGPMELRIVWHDELDGPASSASRQL